MKGISGAIVTVIFLVVTISVIGVFAVYYMAISAVPRVAPIAPTYDGEFDDAFLATKGPFYSDFTEGTDCNITTDVLGGPTWTNCIYDTRIAWNATADTSVDSRDWVLSLAVDIDGPVGPSTEIDIDSGAGTSSTGQVADYALKEVKLYTHEDDPVLIEDLTNFIEDQEDIDNAEVGPLEGDEYVLYIVWHTKSISPAFTDGDDIARITWDLETSEDVDTAQITVED
jgi:hypothetical protein